MMNDEFKMTKGNPNGERRLGAESASSFVIRHSSFQRGFTLLELILAILVFSIVLGAIHVVFFSAFRLRNHTTEAVARALPLQQTIAIIKRDLANLAPPGGTLSGQLQSSPTTSTRATGSRPGPNST